MFAILALSLTTPNRAEAKLTVVTTIAQIAEPLREIAGDRAEVTSLMGEGVDPHLYRPTRTDMVKLTRADIVFWNGLDLEAQMEEALERLATTRPVISIAEALAGDRLLPWDGKAHDPHIWMDPALWRAAIGHAVEVLKRHDPDGGTAIQANADAYFSRLDQLDAYAAKAIASIPVNARILVTAHDAFGYFGRRFDLEVLGIQGISTENEAGLRKIEEMVAILVDREVPAVFVETSVSDRNVRALVEGARAREHAVRLGGRLYSDAMGPAGTYEGTYIGMIDHNVTTIVRALGGTAPERGHIGRMSDDQ